MANVVAFPTGGSRRRARSSRVGGLASIGRRSWSERRAAAPATVVNLSAYRIARNRRRSADEPNFVFEQADFNLNLCLD